MPYDRILSGRRGAWRRLVVAGLATFAVGAAEALCLGCTCTVSVTNIVMPSYNPLSSAHADSSGNIRLRFGGAVSLGVPYSVALSVGSGGGFLARSLKSGSLALAYNLYPSAAMASVWGDGTGGSGLWESTVLFDVFGSSPTINLPVHAHIPGGQKTVAPGSYSDSVTVTVTYY